MPKVGAGCPGVHLSPGCACGDVSTEGEAAVMATKRHRRLYKGQGKGLNGDPRTGSLEPVACNDALHTPAENAAARRRCQQLIGEVLRRSTGSSSQAEVTRLKASVAAHRVSSLDFLCRDVGLQAYQTWSRWKDRGWSCCNRRIRNRWPCDQLALAHLTQTNKQLQMADVIQSVEQQGATAYKAAGHQRLQSAAESEGRLQESECSALTFA